MNLNSSVQFIKGVGPKKLKELNKLDIYTIQDILYNFPRLYEDRGNINSIYEVINNKKFNNELVHIKAKVINKKIVNSRKKIINIMVKDETNTIEIVFFNSNYLYKFFKIGDEYFFYGKLIENLGKKQILHPDYIGVEEENNKNKIYPIYSLTKGFSQKERRKIQKEAINYIELIDEFLPEETINRNKLCDIKYAMKNVHFPNSNESLNNARFRLIFEELLVLQAGLISMKNIISNNNKGIKFHKKDNLREFIDILPFKLTTAQKNVIKEIETDMESDKMMNRLVQGDVGSGKTIVAFVAIYKAVLNGYQGVLMAPTEILAQQHYDTAKSLFNDYNIKIEVLSSNINRKKKIDILEKLKNGDINILVGTHAVIQENVIFNNLGLVVTDEQHRFGVRQRNILAQKGNNPDVLVMTATPIPRTLALILYGDLDISVIDELPPGRKKIKTYSINKNKRKDAYNFIKKEIKKGRQAYIVAPLIEESDKIKANSATAIFEELSKEIFNEYNVCLLHGNMKPHEKDLVMEKFKNKEIDVIVATVVIEVGINVPNASVMLIENSERFGLAQLHQLRGRVGRGEYQSYCILINYSNSNVSKLRANIMQKTDNGFIIAEKDLELRGPGDFFGTKQHGLPELKIANLFEHIKILKIVQDEIKLIIENDPYLINRNNEKLKKKINDTFNNPDNSFSL